MKVALVSLNTIVGDIDGNKRKVITWIEKAKRLGAELVCFQEMTLLGYPPRDILELPYIINKSEEALKECAQHAQGIAVVLGSVSRQREAGSKALKNVALWCEEGQIRHEQAKTLLPSYDVFDEMRYFEPASSHKTFTFKGQTIGLTVCEDIWNGSPLSSTPNYKQDPILELTRTKLDILINISASPYSMGKQEIRQQILQKISADHGCYTLYVNQVGANDELIFDGCSMIYSPEGKLISKGPSFKEGMQVCDLKHADNLSAQQENSLAQLEKALILGVRDYVKKCGFQKVALGLSGGVDSALVAYIAQKALGSSEVEALLMPSRYSSAGSLKDAKALVKNLGIHAQTLAIDPIHKAYEKEFKKLFGSSLPDATEENIQARIRGNLLMALSNKKGHLILTTGNKSEYAVGYSTLYGDMSGGLAVISDLPKTLVYDLCAYINRRKEIIPQNILDKPPSAELRPDQKDSDSLPPYNILDEIIRLYVEEMKSAPEIVSLGHDKKIVNFVTSLIKKNEYKRRQAPPGLRVTSKAFGMGRRFPIACRL